MEKTVSVNEEEEKRKGLQDARPQGTWRLTSIHVGEVDNSSDSPEGLLCLHDGCVESRLRAQFPQKEENLHSRSKDKAFLIYYFYLLDYKPQ